MKRSKIEIAEEIKADKELRPYFIDYLGENLKMTFSQFTDVDISQSQRFLLCADSKLDALMHKLEDRVPKKYVEFVLQEVCRHYANMSVVSDEHCASSHPAFTF
jgi:hypothetical protein